ncbi:MULTISPECIES: hypothetical protein [Paenibacillus]|uniref:hypothetical protein n=1 Tax=Paenibacillus TaxID=44249 RepID=UPI0022B91C36|nr:hypothetical protein [Paenibacillus caseinilyticus]MCZ8520372.1 hypothetical protein [Paenibacillus caseinilyticus]
MKPSWKRRKERRLPLAAAGAAIVLLLMGGGLLVPAAKAADRQHWVGDVIDQVLSTDIAAYVNGKAIPSMNISGSTAIVVEDLRHYGFDVSWNPDEHKVTVQYRPGKPVDPLPAAPLSSEPVGTKLGDVLHTDIRTFYGDREIPSFNIGGRTAVLLSGLQDAGEVKWEAAQRKVSFTPAASGGDTAPYRPAEPVIIRQTGQVSLDGIVFGEKTITYKDKEVGLIIGGQPLLSVSFLAEAFGYTAASHPAEDAYSFAQGGYSFKVHRAAKMSERFWFGTSVAPPQQLEEAAVVRGGRLYIGEQSLKSLFGYSSSWDPEARTLAITYARYSTEVYGFKERLDNRWYPVRIAAFFTDQGELGTFYANNTVNGNPQSNQGFSGAGTDERENGMHKYVMETSLHTDFGINHMSVGVTAGGRVLYHQAFDAELTMDRLKPVYDPSSLRGQGQFSEIVVESPQGAWVDADGDQVEIRGYAEKKFGDDLEFVIEKRTGEGTYAEQSRNKAAFEGSRFETKLKLGEKGEYRILIQSKYENPKFSGRMDVACFYTRVK